MCGSDKERLGDGEQYGLFTYIIHVKKWKLLCLNSSRRTKKMMISILVKLMKGREREE